MKTRSKKNKGRRLQNLVAKHFRDHYTSVPGDDRKPSDIKPAIMGEQGKDIKFYGYASDLYPYAIECKNQERVNIWASLEQAEANADQDEVPLLFFKRNGSKVYVAMDMRDFFLLTHGWVIL